MPLVDAVVKGWHSHESPTHGPSPAIQIIKKIINLNSMSNECIFHNIFEFVFKFIFNLLS